MADRREIINEILLAIVCDRIKAECSKLIATGADINAVNDTLPDIIAYYSTWQAETLQRCLTMLDTDPHAHSDNVIPLN